MDAPLAVPRFDDTLELIATAMETTDDLDTVAEVLLAMRRLATGVAAVRSAAEHAALRLLDTDGFVTARGCVLSKQRHATRTGWDNEALRGAVARRVIADAETGEVRSGPEVWDAVNAAYLLSGSSARKTWLRDHGIDPDEYAGRVEYSDRLRVEWPDD